MSNTPSLYIPLIFSSVSEICHPGKAQNFEAFPAFLGTLLTCHQSQDSDRIHQPQPVAKETPAPLNIYNWRSICFPVSGRRYFSGGDVQTEKRNTFKGFGCCWCLVFEQLSKYYWLGFSFDLGSLCMYVCTWLVSICNARVYSASNHKEGWWGNRGHRWCRSPRGRRVRSAPSYFDKDERTKKKVLWGRPTLIVASRPTVVGHPTLNFVGCPTIADRPTKCIISTKIFK